MTAIPNPDAAMAFAKALRSIHSVMVGAIETNNAELLLGSISALSSYTTPGGPVCKSRLIVDALLLDEKTNVVERYLEYVKTESHGDSGASRFYEIDNTLFDEVACSLISILPSEAVLEIKDAIASGKLRSSSVIDAAFDELR